MRWMPIIILIVILRSLDMTIVSITQLDKYHPTTTVVVDNSRCTTVVHINMYEVVVQ
jgi:hypothetical protein